MALLWLFAALWVAASLAVGILAHKTGRSFFEYTMHSMCLTPVGGALRLRARHRRNGPRVLEQKGDPITTFTL